MINKKFLILGAAIVTLLIIFAIVLQQKTEFTIPEENGKTKIIIGQNHQAYASFPVFVAVEKGIFNEYGLDVQLVEMLDSSIMAQALMKKEIDYSGPIPAVFSLQGAPIKAIFNAFEKPIPNFLIAQPGLRMNALKTIAVPNLHTSTHYVALKMIEENNLSAEIISSGGSGGLRSIFFGKQVDAIVIPMATEPLRLVKLGAGTVLFTIDWHTPQGLVTTDDKIKNNPEEVEQMIKAMQSAIKFIKDNPEESKKLLLKINDLEETEVNQKLIEEVSSILKDSFGEKSIPNQDWINTTIKLGKAGAYETLDDIEKQIVTDEDIAAVFDFRFVK